VTTLAELLEGSYQPASQIFQAGLNPGDPGGKSNPGQLTVDIHVDSSLMKTSS